MKRTNAQLLGDNRKLQARLEQMITQYDSAASDCAVMRDRWNKSEARVREIESQVCHEEAKLLVEEIAELKARVRELTEEKNRLRPCRGCPTVTCTCLSELEDDLLSKATQLKEENAILRKVVDTLRTLTVHHRGLLINSQCACTACHALREFEELDRAERGGG